MIVWKEICGFEGRYEVSNHGQIRNMKTKDVFAKKTLVTVYGYEKIVLRDHQQVLRSKNRLHRLTALDIVSRNLL